MQNEYFECMCFSDEHMVKFIYFDSGELSEMPELILSTYLETGNIFSRIWGAIKYIIGYKSKYGDFSSSWFDPENCDRLIGLLEKYKKEYSNWTANNGVDMSKNQS